MDLGFDHKRPSKHWGWEGADYRGKGILGARPSLLSLGVSCRWDQPDFWAEGRRVGSHRHRHEVLAEPVPRPIPGPGSRRRKAPSWGGGVATTESTGVRSLGSPERSGTDRPPSPKAGARRKRRAPGPRRGTHSSGFNTKTTNRASGHARPDPGIRPGSDLTMVRVVGRTRVLAPLGLRLGSGKGKHRRLRTCCPLTGAAAALPLAKMAALSHVSAGNCAGQRAEGGAPWGWDCARKARTRLGQGGTGLAQAMGLRAAVSSLVLSARV